MHVLHCGEPGMREASTKKLLIGLPVMYAKTTTTIGGASRHNATLIKHVRRIPAAKIEGEEVALLARPQESK